MTGVGWRSPVAVAATATYRQDPSANQDAVVVLDAERDGCTAVVVADGVGSWARSGLASVAAADAAADALRHLGPEGLDRAFAAAWPAVQALQLDSRCPPDQAGTTLLMAAIGADGALHLGYVGNGAIFAVVPTPGTEGSPPPHLWTNFLLPHSGFEDGREVLTRSYNTLTAEEPAPSLLRLDLRRPCTVVVATDGIWSEEQSPLARTADGRLWEERPSILTRTLDLAAELAARPFVDDEMTNATGALASHLDRLAAEGLLSDDASIGLIIV